MRGVMIDGPGVTDRDDAVWVMPEPDGWRAWVHVADVAGAVRLGSTVDVEACRRGESRYLPDRTVTMLPQDLQDQVALRPDRPAATMVVELRVSGAGEITGIRLERGELREPAAATYEQAAAALDDLAHPLRPMLRAAYDLARTLLARRQAAGALAVYDLLRGWASTEDGGLVALASAERNAGYLIVQELMIAANEAAARWAVARGVPILFRNHRPGSATRQALAEHLAIVAGTDGAGRAETVRQHLAMVLRPAVYEPRVGGHFGLNLPAYTHVTSPLRRYPDLVNQRILAATAAGARTPYRVDTLEETAATVNLRHEARRARRAAHLRSAAHEQTRQQLVETDYRELDDATFGKLVRLAVAEDRLSPALAEEITRRAEESRLLPRDAAVALLDAGSGAWQAVRRRLLRWLADQPAHALTLLTLHVQRVQAAPVRWEERAVGTATRPRFRARAHLAGRSSPAREAPAKRAARQQAALGLVAALADLPDPSTDIEPDGPEPAARQRVIPADHPPVSAVNELAQAGALTGLTWSFESDGSAHQPHHTCTVSARRAGTAKALMATGTGATKRAAKQAAAATLWAELAGTGVAGAATSAED